MVTPLDYSATKQTEAKDLSYINPLVISPIALPIIVGEKASYGGTESVVARLIEGLYKNGNYSYVLATGDSDLNGLANHLVSFPEHLWKIKNNYRNDESLKNLKDKFESHYLKAIKYANRFNVDLVHDHPGNPGDFFIDSKAYLNSVFNKPIAITLHNNPNEREGLVYERWRKLQREGRNIHFYAISESQKRRYEEKTGIKVTDVVYNGLQEEKFPLTEFKQDYLFWIGRICRDKGTDLAIHAARKAEVPLIIAGEIREQDYFDSKVKPHITNQIRGRRDEETRKNTLVEKLHQGEEIAKPGQIIYTGALNEQQKIPFFQYARGLIAPNRWEEPFGLMLIEAMATGTPVIGTKRGSLPEVIKDSVTGYVVEPSEDEEKFVSDLADAVNNLQWIEPMDCRQRVEENFTRSIMTQRYLEAYSHII